MTIVLGKRLLVRPLPREEKSKGGIILPAVTGARVGKATILAAGDGICIWHGEEECELRGMIAHYVNAPGVGAELPDGTLLLHEDQVLTIEESGAQA